MQCSIGKVVQAMLIVSDQFPLVICRKSGLSSPYVQLGTIIQNVLKLVDVQTKKFTRLKIISIYPMQVGDWKEYANVKEKKHLNI